MADDDPSVPAETPSDEALWQAFVGGDDGALEVLVRRYRDALYWYLVLSTGNQQAAAQHLIHIWELVARYRRPFDGFDSFKSWIYAVTTQAAMPATQPDMVGLADLLDDVRRNPELSRRGDVFFGVRDLLRAARQPFVLVAVAGLSIEETAKACNFTRGRVVSGMSEALWQLARLASFAGRKGKDELQAGS